MSGTWCTSDEDIEEIVLDYYKKLFSSSKPCNILNAVGNFPKIISEETPFSMLIPRKSTLSKIKKIFFYPNIIHVELSS